MCTERSIGCVATSCASESAMSCLWERPGARPDPSPGSKKRDQNELAWCDPLSFLIAKVWAGGTNLPRYACSFWSRFFALRCGVGLAPGLSQRKLIADPCGTMFAHPLPPSTKLPSLGPLPRFVLCHQTRIRWSVSSAGRAVVVSRPRCLVAVRLGLSDTPAARR